MRRLQVSRAFYNFDCSQNGMSKVNPYRRYQTGLVISDIFPNTQGICACGCGRKLEGRQKRWSSKDCERTALTYFLIIKGDTQTIRSELYKRDAGICAQCGDRSQWHAHHILPVAQGGSATDLDNFATLCIQCHKANTVHDLISILSHHMAISEHAYSTCFIRCLNEDGADEQVCPNTSMEKHLL